MAETHRESPSPEFGAMEINLVNGGGSFLLELTQLKLYGRVTTTKFMSCQIIFITASSDSCVVQGMENKEGNRFGLQFHPEVNDSEFGKEMFENFVEVCQKFKSSKN